MKPPIKIEDLAEMWIKDAKIDELNPGKELLNIPNLHAKYLRIMSHHNLMAHSLQKEYNEKRRLMMEYYSGDLNNKEDLERLGLEPALKKILKSEISTYLDSDPLLNKILLKKMMHMEIVKFCEMVIKELNSRTYQIRSMIQWTMFQNGA